MPSRRNLTVLIIAIATFAAGYLFGHQNLKFEGSLAPKLVNKELAKPREVDFSLFWEAWNLLEDKFIGTINYQNLVLGAIRGMVESVSDPYTVFLPPDESEAFLEDLSGRFEGIGAEIGIKDDKLIIVAPLDGSPAAEAGLKARDWVVSIDDESTDSMTVAEAVGKIRGRAGTKVKLTILSDGSREARDVEVKRASIKVDSVRLSYRQDAGGRDIAVLKIVQFGSDTAELTKKYADEISAKKPSGLIIDLRNNPGGYLDAAIDVTSLLLNDQVILKEKNKNGSIDTLERTLSAKLADIPLAVLINEGSASASEIMAGAIQDYGRGKLIGQTSFGKGSVQDLEPLRGGSSLRVTVAKWLTPKGREIDKEGIKPDIEVELTEEDSKAERDPQLEKAIEEIEFLITSS